MPAIAYQIKKHHHNKKAEESDVSRFVSSPLGKGEKQPQSPRGEENRTVPIVLPWSSFCRDYMFSLQEDFAGRFENAIMRHYYKDREDRLGAWNVQESLTAAREKYLYHRQLLSDLL